MSKADRKERTYPFPYHHELVLRIETLTHTGSGLGRVSLEEAPACGGKNRGGWVVQVPFTIPGELVRARVFRNHANFSEADVMEILEPSEHRRPARCKLFMQCGGCQLQHIAYQQQLLFKKRGVEEALHRGAGVVCEVSRVVGSPVEYGYRTKITPHFQKPRGGVVDAIGFLRHGQMHKLVDVEHCPIARDEINSALPLIREQVRARATRYKNGATLLLRADDHGVHCQPHEICRQRVGGLEFLFPAGAFFQNNTHILPELTAHVTRTAKNTGASKLLDVYCGSGLLGLCAAKEFSEVIGVEIDEDSVLWAQQNATHNRIANARFFCGDAEKIFAHAPADARDTVVVLDPPRAGCSESFLAQLINYAPCAVVYVSCHPATQARDIKEMLAAGYNVREVAVFDLFPQTHHVESVVLLTK